MAHRRLGKKIGEKHVIIDGTRGYTAELRYSQDNGLFYAYYKEEYVEGQTEGELAPLLKALVAKHELLTFEFFIEINVSGYVHEGRRGGGTGTGGEQLELDAQLYQLNVDYRLWAVAVNELEQGTKRVHVKSAWVDARDQIRTDDRIDEVGHDDVAEWVKYTPERLAVLDQVRRGMVELHNKLAGIFGKGDAAAKFLDAPRGLMLLGKGGGK